MIKFIPLFCLLSMPSYAEFNFNAGVSLSNNTQAQPEVKLQDPLGILRVQYKTEKESVIFCEHISSIPKKEIGRGLNHCGFLIKL